MSARIGNAAAAPEISLAEQHDAAGRHDDAINLLARATQRGDVEATTRLAKRLVVGDRAPLLAREGIDLLGTAAEHGGAEAAEKLAMLAAVGASGRHDWPRALSLLAVAAERGWQPAQQQLGVLASMGLRAGAGVAGASTDWQRLGAAIDVAAWSALGEHRTLHEDPLVRLFPGFVTREVCEWLIAQARPKLMRARVYNPYTKADIVDQTRTNSAAGFNLMETDLVHLMVQARMEAACGQPLAHMEGATVLHYAVGEEITNHYDFVDPAIPNYADEVRSRGQRIITFLVYLNDDYDRGETDFPKLGFAHKGRLGDGLYFVNALADNEPDTRMIHAGRPPARGEKWILSQFIRNLRVLRIAP
jgi:hypothetical protein